MADTSAGAGARCSDDCCSREADILVIVGEGDEPASALREARALCDVFEALAIALRQKGINARPGLDTMRVIETPARRRAGGDWWQRLGAGAMLVVLLLVGSAILPPSRPVQAEAQLGKPIPVGTLPEGIGVNPVTNRVYVANVGSDTVTVIDGETEKVAAKPIAVGHRPFAVAVNPATNRVYVTLLGSNAVAVIDGATNALIGSPIAVGRGPESVAVNPTTNRVYVANAEDDTVTVIDGSNGTIIGSPIPVGDTPAAVAVNPNSNRVYVANFSNFAQHGTVSVIDGANNTAVGSPIEVDPHPFAMALNPVINRVYVASSIFASLSEIDGATNTVIGTVFPIESGTGNIGINPASNRVYVVSTQGHQVTVIDGATNTVVGTPVSVGNAAEGVGVNPVTGRVYVGTQDDNVVSVLGVPFGATPSTASTVAAVTTTWSSLFAPDSHDFVGFFESGAPNTEPLTKRFANGNGTGPGVPAGSIDLAIPTNLVLGHTYDIRFVSGSSGGTLARIVEVPPPSIDDTYDANSGIALTIPAAIGVLANDTTGDPSLLRATVETKPAHGTLTLQTNGAFTYTATPSFVGRDTFVYRVTNQFGLSATGTVTLRVTAAPVGVNDAYSVAVNTILNVPAPGVIANDTDADSPSLKAERKTGPAHGTLALQPNGAFTYKPSEGFSGTDGFTYIAADQTNFSAPVTVTIKVAAPPVGVNDTYTVATGGALNVPAPGVLANDTDPDSPSLQAVLAANPAHGTLALQPSGGFSYTPAAGFSGTDSFTYRASDQTSGSAPVTVVITVTAVAPAPTPAPGPLSDCGPRPPATVTQAVSVGKLAAHVQVSPLSTQQPNTLRTLRFGTLQNAKVTLNGQPIASGQTVTVPAGSNAVDFTVERATPGQATTVPFTVVDTCGEWQTFVGGGPGPRILTVAVTTRNVHHDVQVGT